MGVIGAAHGIRGECRVKSHAQNPVELARYSPFFLEDGRALRVASSRPLKDDMLVMRFDGITDRTAVEALTGKSLIIDRALLPEADEDEFYHADLVGLDVVDEAGVHYGALAAIHDFGAGDVLEIRPAKGATWFHPFTRAGVPKVEIANGRIVIDPALIPGDDEEPAP